jgi:uncharacterized protein
MKKAVLAGGSGFLGQALARSLLADGYEAVVLSRSVSPSGASGRFVPWDGQSLGEWKKELEGAEAVFNLTGRSVDCRYTEANRELILNSRVDSTKVLGQAIRECVEIPKVWLNSSTATIYEDRRGNLKPHDEGSDDLGSGFSVSVAQAWEKAFRESSNEGVRKVALRVSIVLGKDGGAFPVMKRFAKLGLGGGQGPGSQWMSWLHVDDWVGAARFLMEHSSIDGPVNLASPNPVTNAFFMREMRKEFAPLGVGFPAPSLFVRIGAFFMRTAPELVLKSRKVVSATLPEAGYSFKYSDLAQAIRDLAA